MTNKSHIKHEKIELKKRLARILRCSGNKICADCSEKRPDLITFLKPQKCFATGSTTLAGFVCAECADIQKKLGSQICFVRSIYDNDFEKEDIKCAENSGNDVINEIFEGHLQKAIVDGMQIKPSPGAKVATKERYIRQKYVELYFYRKRAHHDHISEVKGTIPQSLQNPERSKPSIKRSHDVSNELNDFLADEPPPKELSKTSLTSITVGTQSTEERKERKKKGSTSRSRTRKKDKDASDTDTAGSCDKTSGTRKKGERRSRRSSTSKPASRLNKYIDQVSPMQSPMLSPMQSPRQSLKQRLSTKRASEMKLPTCPNVEEIDELSGMVLVFDQDKELESPKVEEKRSRRDRRSVRKNTSSRTLESTKSLRSRSQNRERAQNASSSGNLDSSTRSCNMGKRTLRRRRSMVGDVKLQNLDTTIRSTGESRSRHTRDKSSKTVGRRSISKLNASGSTIHESDPPKRGNSLSRRSRSDSVGKITRSNSLGKIKRTSSTGKIKRTNSLGKIRSEHRERIRDANKSRRSQPAKSSSKGANLDSSINSLQVTDLEEKPVSGRSSSRYNSSVSTDLTCDSPKKRNNSFRRASLKGTCDIRGRARDASRSRSRSREPVPRINSESKYKGRRRRSSTIDVTLSSLIQSIEGTEEEKSLFISMKEDTPDNETSNDKTLNDKTTSTSSKASEKSDESDRDAPEAFDLIDHNDSGFASWHHAVSCSFNQPHHRKKPTDIGQKQRRHSFWEGDATSAKKKNTERTNRRNSIFASMDQAAQIEDTNKSISSNDEPLTRISPKPLKSNDLGMALEKLSSKKKLLLQSSKSTLKSTSSSKKSKNRKSSNSKGSETPGLGTKKKKKSKKTKAGNE